VLPVNLGKSSSNVLIELSLLALLHTPPVFAEGGEEAASQESDLGNVDLGDPDEAVAEEGDAESEIEPDAPTPLPARGRRGQKAAPLSREAEGTTAVNRFTEQPNRTSKYKHNGQPLEVDPD
jgi:hypothetical protein